ncbi:hypothetical protein VNO80_13948 [Phaseolus coccineus]|uniref:Uncharacterized protein n=1 Tax=Phaseolus coccineus TaxID=3886 RepID=A0AAN9N7F9_PHACN
MVALMKQHRFHKWIHSLPCQRLIQIDREIKREIKTPQNPSTSSASVSTPQIIMSLCYVLYRHHCAHIIITITLLFSLALNHPTNLNPPPSLLLLLLHLLLLLTTTNNTIVMKKAKGMKHNSSNNNEISIPLPCVGVVAAVVG